MEYYLKSHVKAEMLMWKWFAWAYLIPPIQAGCNIVERHLKIMESYVKFPKIHVQAVKNPSLMGGPFLDLSEENASLIKQLIEETTSDCSIYIELNNDLKKFQAFLKQEAVGNSLEPFYEKTPESLQGLVELVYDINNNPQVLLIEKLIYNTYYSTDGQSISLSLLNDDKRSFIMSTPRVITKENELNIKLPFIDSAWDELFMAKSKAIDFNSLAIKFGIEKKDLSCFKALFTTVPPKEKLDKNYDGGGVRIRYFGHASILLQTNKISLLTDPLISYDITGSFSRYSYSDLPDRIDYVLLTHNHQDHVLFETLIQIRHKVGTVIVPRNRKGALEDPSLKLILNYIGYKKVIEIDDLESIEILDGEIIGTPFLGEHSDLNIQTKTAYCVKLKDTKFLLAADSNNISPKMYKYVFEYLQGIDILFLGMECDGAPLSWLYGVLLNEPLKKSYDNERKLSGSNFEKAWALAKESKCKQAYVYAMGLEPWLTHIMALQYKPDSIQITESDKFVKTCLEHNIQSERLFMKKEWVV